MDKLDKDELVDVALRNFYPRSTLSVLVDKINELVDHVNNGLPRGVGVRDASEIIPTKSSRGACPVCDVKCMVFYNDDMLDLETRCKQCGYVGEIKDFIKEA